MSLRPGTNAPYEDGPITFLILRLATIGGFVPSDELLAHPYIRSILDYGDSWELGQSEAIQAMSARDRLRLFLTALKMLDSDKDLAATGFYERHELQEARFDLKHYGHERVRDQLMRYLAFERNGDS